ncbi:MAG TPA: hypothetical protein VKB88_26760 [Bryobacteraceae bacterium]|nr:hypothetical protein [Bryobacteraceae bacterium]
MSNLVPLDALEEFRIQTSSFARFMLNCPCSFKVVCVSSTPGANSNSELKLRPFKGRLSTNRLLMMVLTDASETLTIAVFPSSVARTIR